MSFDQGLDTSNFYQCLPLGFDSPNHPLILSFSQDTLILATFSLLLAAHQG